MRIEAVETKVYRIPPSVPWEDAIQRVTNKEWIITEVLTDQGTVGVGWSHTMGAGGTAIKTLIDDDLAPLIIGENPTDIRRICENLWRTSKGIGTGGAVSLAIAPIDIALWDIVAKVQNKPLHEVLGRVKDRIGVYASGINLSLDIEDLLHQVNGYLEEGYETVKIKVGKDSLEEDIERVAEVRKLIGPRRSLLVDANQKWTVGQATSGARMLEEFNVGWIEEPLNANDLQGHIDFRQKTRTSVALGENLWNSSQFFQYIRRGACDVVQPDLARVGGITEWLKIATLANSANLPIAPHSMMEISLQVMCSVPNSLVLENITGGSFAELGIVKESLVPNKGYLEPPNSLGHGIAFDKKIIAQYEAV